MRNREDLLLSAQVPPERRSLEWTPELVGRFWDNQAKAQVHDDYFTFMVGAEITEFVSYATDLRGRHVLDYGCGPGYLVDHLLTRGARVTAADYSAETLNKVNERFRGRDGFEGAVQITEGTIAVADQSVDLITCIETIEHMFEDARAKLLTEFRRVLKPGGYVLLTTPNCEDLDRFSVYCPHCGHVFHRMQHLCSWTKQSLTQFLSDGGFVVEFCEGINLGRWSEPKKRVLEMRTLDISLRDVLRDIRGALYWIQDRLFPRPFPNNRIFQRLVLTVRPVHLVAVARKR
jgi:2-polyprenyl-3-methyl-5-hydroxy-6-metoxy-1,4-benzoquinol methylase